MRDRQRMEGREGGGRGEGERASLSSTYLV